MKVLDSFRLDGKLAIVTGGGGGLGSAIAEAMAEAGADVGVVDKDEMGASETAKMVELLGRRSLAVKADISKEEDVVAMMQRITKELGPLDIIFANAGILNEPDPIPDGKLRDWQNVIDINLTGVYLTLREAAKLMIPRKQGKMIATASVVGIVSTEKGSAPAYTASKGGVVSLTKTFSVALAQYGIQVNSFAPGFFITNLSPYKKYLQQENPGEEGRQAVASRLGKIPLRKFAYPADLKGLALFLSSSASDYITGATIPIDGGLLAV
ncbi:MAG: SDR family NAD(P)-dependent oxidoreductase [Thermodesulfobacteriota bacterium]